MTLQGLIATGAAALTIIGAMLIIGVIFIVSFVMDLVGGTTCMRCAKRIWPWQSRGWYIWSDNGVCLRWHAACSRI